ncbi:MAG TPA: DUF72 domain-containing protein [Flavisolibacter sp.]|jgi:uncharacterized protein YecE (DUF72 family)|nr:DUF72 domain-containing protein [Flavisolibacter sp.]
MSVHIGTSGWSYNHWQGILYPHATPVWNRLGYYLGRFNTVELNASFYRWPKVATFQNWQKRLPQGFLFTVKAPRYLTHHQRLYAPEKWINRIKQCWHALGDKRAVLLVQLSPNFPVDLERLHYFLAIVPDWIRIAFEFRHPSWHQEAVFRLLEQFGAAYCIMSGAYLPCILQATASFVYIRMHGLDPHHLYSGSYTDTDLWWWVNRIQEWEAQGKEVFVYFNNDGNGFAIYNAERLRQFLF